MNAYTARQLTALALCVITISALFFEPQDTTAQERLTLPKNLERVTWSIKHKTPRLGAMPYQYLVEFAFDTDTLEVTLPYRYLPNPKLFLDIKNTQNQRTLYRDKSRYSRDQIIYDVIREILEDSSLRGQKKNPKSLPFRHPLGTKTPKKSIIL